jgi:hypothetical protein
MSDSGKDNHIPNVQRLWSADDVNLVGENINIVKKNTHALLDASKDIGLHMCAEKTKSAFMSCHQTTCR